MNGACVIAGYGRGISHAVALKFGKERGHSLALLCRTQSKLDPAVKEFNDLGVKTIGLPTDLSDTQAVLASLEQAKKQLGDVALLFWNGGSTSKPLLEMTSEDIHYNLRISVDSLLFATKNVLSDLERLKGAVLVTGGGFGDDTEEMAQLALQYGAATLALNKASQKKLVQMLHVALKPRGVFVGEVTVHNMVAGSDWDPKGTSSLTPGMVADAFAALLDARSDTFAVAH